MRFTDQVWEDAAGLRAAMRTLPFNAELSAGTLSKSRFRHYMQQDALYLEGFGRALALGAAKAPDADQVLHFADAAKTAIVVERALHTGYLAQFGVTPADLAAAEPSPTCAGYVNFLLATGLTGSFAELSAALLPCFWVYREVGLFIKDRAAPDNFFQAWIDTYSDEAFGEAVARMIAAVEAAASHAGAREQERMRRAFLRCCQYEWMFWDAAYREEPWPVAP